MRCLYVFNKLSGGNKEIYYHEKIISTLKEIYDNVDLFEVGTETYHLDYLKLIMMMLFALVEMEVLLF